MVKHTDIELSIIIEWENILLSEDERCFQMLHRLCEQLGEINRITEIIVVFNPDQVERTSVEKVLKKHLVLPVSDVSIDLRLEEAPGCHYYELKNKGATRSSGKIVVFIDSDIIPEANWLKEISQPFFDNPEIKVVAGHTYLCHESFMEKVFALGWFFPLRNPGNALYIDSEGFFANNVAFRSEIIGDNPFPNLPQGVTRGDCTRRLTQKLTSLGIPIWTNTAARAQHPPPTDLRHYTIRGLAHGRDYLITHADEYGKTFIRSFDNTLYYFVKKILLTLFQIKNGYKAVNLPLWQTPVAYCVMTYFYTLALLGSLVTLLFPDYARNHWQI